MAAPRPLAEVTAAWRAETQRLAPEILRDPVAYALATITQHLIEAAEAELRALRAELDTAWPRVMLLAPAAYLRQAADASPDAEVGTVIQATDSPRRAVRTESGWEFREA